MLILDEPPKSAIKPQPKKKLLWLFSIGGNNTIKIIKKR
jgi:hypothetical protein